MCCCPDGTVYHAIIIKPSRWSRSAWWCLRTRQQAGLLSVRWLVWDPTPLSDAAMSLSTCKPVCGVWLFASDEVTSCQILTGLLRWRCTCAGGSGARAVAKPVRSWGVRTGGGRLGRGGAGAWNSCLLKCAATGAACGLSALLLLLLVVPTVWTACPCMQGVALVVCNILRCRPTDATTDRAVQIWLLQCSWIATQPEPVWPIAQGHSRCC